MKSPTNKHLSVRSNSNKNVSIYNETITHSFLESTGRSRKKCPHNRNSSKHHNTSSSKSSTQNPQQCLLNQLQTQITQLFPVRTSFTNLSYYYKQLKSDYQDLLQQMNDSHHVASFGRFKEGSLQGQSNQKLRQLDGEYENLSDYLNQHLVAERLKKERQANKALSMQFASYQQQLAAIKSKLRAQTQLQIQLAHQINKTQQQKQISQTLHLKSLHRLSSLQQQQSSLQIKAQSLKHYLNHLKQKQKQSLQRQSSILQQMIQRRKKNSFYVSQIKTSQEKQSKTTKEISALDKLRTNLIEKRLMVEKKKLKAIYQLKVEQQQTAYLQGEIRHKQQLIKAQQVEIASIQAQENSQLSKQLGLSRPQNKKSSQFLLYLKSYSAELKQTSNLMYQRLKQCCKQDYENMARTRQMSQNHYLNQILEKEELDFHLLEKEKYLNSSYLLGRKANIEAYSKQK